MTINPLAASNAYSAAKALAKSGAGAEAGQGVGAGQGFGDLMKSLVTDTQATGMAAEGKAADLATGKADIVDLVTAVSETEVAVETLVSVRDRVIKSYQDIMNMPV